MKNYLKPCPNDPLRPVALLLLATLAAVFAGPLVVLFILYPLALAFAGAALVVYMYVRILCRMAAKFEDAFKKLAELQSARR